MGQTLLLEQIAPLQEAAKTVGTTEGVLNVVIVYEDDPTRQWAREVCERAADLAGQGIVRSTWWRMGELGDPAVLAGAVSTTLRADVVVVAIHAAEGFPLPFYVWVESWLPHRAQAAGALLALVGQPEGFDSRMDRAREYLHAVARQGRLDFLSEERKLDLAEGLYCPTAGRAANQRRVVNRDEWSDGVMELWGDGVGE